MRHTDHTYPGLRRRPSLSLLAAAVATAALVLAASALPPTLAATRAPGSAGVVVDAAHPLIERMRLVQPTGARAHWSPDGDRMVLDGRNRDGYYDLYMADAQGQILAGPNLDGPLSVRHNGNGIFHPSGNYFVFIAQVTTPHFLDALSPHGRVPVGEPGVGLFNNLWASDGTSFWQLTSVPVKLDAEDDRPVFGTVNPRFSPDGTTLLWTERYDSGGSLKWGKWRLKAARFVVDAAAPRLENVEVVFTPSVGTYVTAMEFLTDELLLVAGNLDGQHEYGMDLYLLHLPSGAAQNLTNTPQLWEEGACVSPGGKIVYMTNRNSRYPLDFARPWSEQPVERDYWIMNVDGSAAERLTYFGDPSAPEYLDWRTVTIICDISPDGRTMAATIGYDFGTEASPWVHWQLWLVDFARPI